MPTKTIRPPNDEDVRQFSVFAENKVGRLNELILAFAERDVHIMAMCIIDTTDSAIIRIVANYPERADMILNERFFAHDTVPVVVVEMAGEHELKKITSSLVQAEINIHYLYPLISCPHGKCGLVMRVEDNDLAERVLGNIGIKVLKQRDLAR